MWSKLSNLFIKQEKKALSPEEVMDATIVSMEEAIQKSTGSFNAAQKRKEELRKRLSNYEAKAAKLSAEATQALKQGEELLAKTILSRKTPLDIQIRDYQKVYDEVAATVYKLEIQLNKMKLQLEQTQAKKALLIAQLSQAESRKEMAQQLDELDISTDIFEEEIIHNQLDAHLQEDDFAQEQEALDQFDQKLAEANSLQQLQEKLAEEEKQRKAIEAERLQKKLQLLFNSTKEKEQQVHKEKQEALAQQKQALLQNFFEATETQERHKNKALLEQFLEENESDKEQREEIKQVLNDFEKTTTEASEEATKK
ncbi:MAG: PspA/IM30 family protein, partial [Bacteroidota bacterium]